MSLEANLSPGQEPQIRMKLAILGYKQGGGRIQKGPSETIFYIKGEKVGTIVRTNGSMIFSCLPEIAGALDGTGLVFR
jgi:hypothetical protein